MAAVNDREPRRYALRSYAKAAPAAPQPVPGSFDSPSVTKEEPSSPNAGATPLSPMTTLSHRTDVSEAFRPALYSEVASRTPSPKLHASGATSSEDLINQFSSLHVSVDRRATVEEVEDEGEPPRSDDPHLDHSLWKEVRYGKRAKSPLNVSRAPSAHGDETGALSDGQLRAVTTAVGGMTYAEQARYESRMKNVAAASTAMKRSDPQEEGSSKRAGKAVDPRNWGAAGIEQ